MDKRGSGGTKALSMVNPSPQMGSRFCQDTGEDGLQEERRLWGALRLHLMQSSNISVERGRDRPLPRHCAGARTVAPKVEGEQRQHTSGPPAIG